jgi:hypothetical protein
MYFRSNLLIRRRSKIVILFSIIGRGSINRIGVNGSGITLPL